MSKPEPPKKIDPLPVSKAAAPKPAEPKKTGWEPPSPQKVRASETRMGILLAFCLLGAIGLVAYKKLDAIRNRPGENGRFAAADGSVAKPRATVDDASGPASGGMEGAPPTASIPAWAQASDNATARQLAPDSSAAADMRIARSDLPDGQEPDARPPDAEFTPDPAWPAQGAEPPGAPAPETPPSGVPVFDFTATASTGDAATPETLSADPASAGTAEAAADPFSNGSLATSDGAPPDQAEEANTWSSDGGIDSQPTTDTDSAATVAELAAQDPPAQSDEPSFGDDAVADMPTIDLFGTPSSTDTGATVASEIPAAEPAVESPFGDAPEGGLEEPLITDSAPPQLIQPNDPQVMPPLQVDPFAGTTEPEPAASDPTPSTAGSPFPLEEGETQIRQRQAVDSVPFENPFTAPASTRVVERSATALQDPFAPARDVSQAVRHEELVVHEVQTGDNFWKIARRYYGSGQWFNALAAYNRDHIPDPQRMKPGMQVLVPSEAALAQQFPQLVSGVSKTPYVAPPSGPPGYSLDARGRPQYRVAKGDTLSAIAERHLGRASRWRQLYGMNRDQLLDANSLTTGMLLRLPSDATAVRMDAASASGR